MSKIPHSAGFGRRVLATIAIGVALVGSSVPPTASAAGGLTEQRKCVNFFSGDGMRRLSICARGWTDPTGIYSRGVVEMHTYRYAPGIGWVDAPARSITMNSASMASSPAPVEWGQDEVNGCRRDSSAGPVYCSTAGVTRVAYYSPLKRKYGSERLSVFVVSWRDDRGVPHTVSSLKSTYPDTLPIRFEWL
jgi:hypothetical protein